jgi:Domain of unknown function (DUF222)
MPGTPTGEPFGQDENPARGSTPDAPGDGWRLLPPPGEDWLTEDEWEEWATARCAEEELPDPEGAVDPDDPSLPADIDIDTLIAEAEQASVEQAQATEAAARAGTAGAMAAVAAGLGRRGPAQPGSAQRFPGTYAGPAGGFATGQPLDTAPGGPVLFGLAEYAAGDDTRFTGSSDDELIGVICGLDRAEAAAAAMRHAAVAELIRRRPAPGCRPQGPAQMPLVWEEFTERELASALAETRGTADAMLGLASDLEVKLPGTRAAFRTGVLRQSKVEIIAHATAVLNPDEARAAEALVLDRAGQLTPAGLRAAITRAVIEVAPEKAAKRREKGQQDARVQRWMEDSGNAALMGRQLPPDEVLAADQRITWWAKKLRQAGLEGDMDQLRARAYLDILLNKDSRPAPPASGTDRENGDPGSGTDGQDSDGPDGRGDGHGDGQGDGQGDGGSGPRDPAPGGPGTPPTAGVIPAGFIGRLHLTIPLITLLDLADRPGEIPGLGAVDPALARDLAGAAAQNPKTTWCVTVTDEHGHAIGHGCGRPEPGNHPPSAHDPPGGQARARGPGFAFTAADQPGPPGGYGAWRLSTGIPGQRGLLVAFDPIATETCDHRFEASGHDPGVKLRHLSQIRHATCTGPGCRRPSTQADFEHNIPYEAGGRSCLCNGGPKCRHDHRLKQHPRWNAEQITPATFRWTTPSGRQYITEATRYPI